MCIYHLELEVMFALEESVYHSAVYSSLEKAIEEGKLLLEKKMRGSYNKGYNIKGQRDITVDELFSIERTDYIFKVTEIKDLEYTENFETKLFGQELWKIKPTHIEYHYNYIGELEYKTIQWKNKNRLLIEEITMHPNDFLPKAGTKFKIGDLVTVNDDMRKDLTHNKIFVVRFLPRRVEGTGYFLNTYRISSTYDREDLAGIFTFEYREEELQRYEGNIEQGSPIKLLQKIIRGELKVSNSLWQDLKNGKISFDTRKNYKDIVELKK